MKRIPLIVLVFAATLFSSVGSAQGIGVTAKVGTLGLGIDITKAITPRFNARLGLNGFTYGQSGTQGGIDYDIDLEMQSLALLADWHPFKGGLRVTAGVLYNNNELSMEAKPSASYNIGGSNYTQLQVGKLTGVVDFDKTAPYAGIGWGNAVEEGQRLTFSFDLGVLFQGSPNVEMKATGTSSGLQADLATEAQQVEDDLDEFEMFPVISAGFAFQF